MPFPAHMVRDMIRSAFPDVFADDKRLAQLQAIRRDIGDVNLYPNEDSLLWFVPALMDWLLDYPSDISIPERGVFPDMLLFYLEAVLINERAGHLLRPNQRAAVLAWIEYSAVAGVWRYESTARLLAFLHDEWRLQS